MNETTHESLRAELRGVQLAHINDGWAHRPEQGAAWWLASHRPLRTDENGQIFAPCSAEKEEKEASPLRRLWKGLRKRLQGQTTPRARVHGPGEVLVVSSHRAAVTSLDFFLAQPCREEGGKYVHVQVDMQGPLAATSASRAFYAVPPSHAPNFKVVAILREPIDRLRSWHASLVRAASRCDPKTCEHHSCYVSWACVGHFGALGAQPRSRSRRRRLVDASESRLPGRRRLATALPSTCGSKAKSVS